MTVRSEINVTPLVDVCLVLLIIFMVVTPLLRGREVELPRTAHPLAMPEAFGQLTIFLHANGDISVGPERVAPERLVASLSSQHASAFHRVVVDGDKEVPYARMTALLAAVQEAGFDRVGLAALRRDEKR
jgi:biopolymer transport protein TolR